MEPQIILLLKCCAKKAIVLKLIFGLWDAFCKLLKKINLIKLLKSTDRKLNLNRYTLLVGHPPFETQSLKDTYSKIKKNEFSVPSRIGPLARALIIRMLHADPNNR